MLNASLARRVLVVEDDPETADLLARYARLPGCETRIAATGAEALRTARTFLPHVVLLDIGLPDMDGWMVAKALRQLLEPTHPVLIAISGCSSQADRERSADAGIDHHLAKPEFRRELMELLMRLSRRPATV